MSEYNSNAKVGISAVKKAKDRNMLKKQRLAIIITAVGVVLLVAALIAVMHIVDIYVYNDVDGTRYYVKKDGGTYALYDEDGNKCLLTEEGFYQTKLGTLVTVDKKTGKCKNYAVVHTEGTEVRDFGEFVLMFKRLTYDAGATEDESIVIKSIEVHNEHGSYTFVRGEKNNFKIVGHEDTSFSKESFAHLAVTCGYTLATRRLESPKMTASGVIDYAEYGLAESKRVRVETDSDGNEIEVEYDYKPAWYVITTMTGESHKIIIGDKTVTGTGYYARYEGRDTIYVVGTGSIENLLLGRIEDFVTPMIVYPMGQTNYINVRDFIIYKDIDYKAIFEELHGKYGSDDTSEEFYKEYEKLFEKYSSKVCDFSFVQIEDREGTLSAHDPYISKLEYAEGYYIDGESADHALYGFYDTAFNRVVKLSPSDEELEEYGLQTAPYVVGFLYRTRNDDGEIIYVENFVEISEHHKEGYYYAYSEQYDMIVEIDENSFDFLEWEEIMWYDSAYIKTNISYVDKIIIESPAFKTEFDIEDSASHYLSYVEQSGNKITAGGKEYMVKWSEEKSSYVLVGADGAVAPTYEGDYLITPLTYQQPEPAADNYLFSEVSEFDSDGDGNNDCVSYYFYSIGYNGKEYSLVAQIIRADYNGKRVDGGKDEVVWGTSALATEYFATRNGYVFLNSKDSAIGQVIDEKYGKQNRGSWGEGNVFVTGDGQYMLVNSKTGAWYQIDNHSEGIYFADSETSRLAKRAVTLPDKYEGGKLKRHGDVYYPTTSKMLLYNEDADKIMAYDKADKAWENVTYSECTIGVWGVGSYYSLGGGILVAVDAASGNWGYVNILTNGSYIADIMSDGEVLDYVIDVTEQIGSSKTATAMENFQQFYKAMLFASFEGMADLSDEQIEELMALDDFSEDSANNPCQLKITMLTRDFHGNERNVVYRFYQYSERRSFVTIEYLDDPSVSDSTHAYGRFYVLRSFVDKIISDAQKVVNAEEVVATSKY